MTFRLCAFLLLLLSFPAFARYKVQFAGDPAIYYERDFGYCRITDPTQLASFGGMNNVYSVTVSKAEYFKSTPFIGECVYPDQDYEKNGAFYRAYSQDKYCVMPPAWITNLVTLYPGLWHKTNGPIERGRHFTGTCGSSKLERTCNYVKSRFSEYNCEVDEWMGEVFITGPGFRSAQVLTLDDIIKGETAEEKLGNLYTLQDGLDGLGSACTASAALCGAATVYIPKAFENIFKVFGISSCTYLFSECQKDVANAQEAVKDKIKDMKAEKKENEKQRKQGKLLNPTAPAGGGGSATPGPINPPQQDPPMPPRPTKVDIIDLPSPTPPTQGGSRL